MAMDTSISNMGIDSSNNGSAGINSGTPKFATKKGDAISGTFVDSNGIVNTGPVEQEKKLPTFLDEVMRAKAPRTLSSEGAEFLKNLKEIAAQKKIGCIFLPENNCYLFHDNKTSVGFVFDEHLPIQRDATPRSKYIDAARNEASFKVSEFPVAEIILVTPSDYNNVAKFEQYIERVLAYGIYAADAFNIKDISDKYYFRVITSKHIVDQVIADMCVHGVLPYYQYGFVLEMNVDKNFSERNVYYGRPNNQDENSWVPILAVPAYTTFTTNNAAALPMLKFIPQIHISEPLCMFPTTKMLPLILSLAVQEFILKGLWKEHFNKFDKASPNIGALWIDPNTNEPGFVNDIRVRDQFIEMRCEVPTLILDVQNGRASIPCMSLINDQKDKDVFLTQFAQFFNDNTFLNHHVVTSMSYPEYTGVVSYEGKMIDSRTFDYFKILPSCKGQMDILEKFISIPIFPDVKLNLLNQIGFNVQSLYDTYMCMIDPAILFNITSCVGAQLKLVNNNNNYQNIDFSSINMISNQMKEGLNRANGTFFTASGIRPTVSSTYSNPTFVRYWGGNR